MKKIMPAILLITSFFILTVTNIFASSTHEMDVNVTIPATVLSAEVPLKLVCAIDPNSSEIDQAFVSPKFKIISQTNAPITVDLDIKIKESSGLNIVSPTDKDWHKLGANQTSQFIALGIKKDATLRWAPSTYSENLKTKGDTELMLEAKHGMAFKPNTSFDLNIITTISLQ